MKLAIYGTGGFGREVEPLAKELWLERAAVTTDRYDVVFVDDGNHALRECNGHQVIDFAQLSSHDHSDREVVVAVASSATREILESKCIDAGLRIRRIISPKSSILHDVEIGAGSIVCDFASITSNVRIGKSFQCNIYSYVAHDCVIGDYVTFAPRVSCNGNVHVGSHAYIGTGAMIVQGATTAPLTIGEGAIVAMGAVVTKPVEPYTLVAGNPARVVRSLDRRPVALS